jgi:hypothetical protein
MYRGWFFEAVVRGRSAQGVGSMPSWEVGRANVHVVMLMRCVQGYGSLDVLRVSPSLSEMENGGGGVLTMESCRDGGGGVDASGKPCLRWLPSSKLDSDPPQRCCGCVDARGLYSSFSGENVLARVSLMTGCGCLERDAWRNLWQLVALVTMFWLRCSSPVTVTVPWIALYPE